MPRQIWGDTELLGTPVAKILEERDQGSAGRAKGVGDLGRRGAHYASADHAIPFQFAKLGGENLFADAAE